MIEVDLPIIHIKIGFWSFNTVMHRFFCYDNNKYVDFSILIWPTKRSTIIVYCIKYMQMVSILNGV